MELTLDLSKHCIETELKTLYNKFVSDYFKNKGVREEVEAAVDTLAYALKTLDFKVLRSSYPALAGHTDASVTLENTFSGKPVISIDSVRIDTGN